MNPNIVKMKSGDLYELDYVVHPAVDAPSTQTDVYAAYRLSAYDGMPIGPRVFITTCDMIEEDRDRLQKGTRR